MRQFFKHFGSKARISAKLPPPRHDTIISPFAGSAAYPVMYAKPETSVILLDSDERVCLIWEFLINATEADILNLPVQHFLDGGDIRDIKHTLSRAEYLFIQRWLSISGTHSHRLAPCLLKDRGGEAGNTWCRKTRARVASQVDLISNWTIVCGDYRDAPNIKAHWDIDPPYQGNSHGFSEYKCDPPDYQHLAKWCLARRGDVTVHEQHGANWLPFRTLNKKQTTNRTVNGKRTTAHEVFWTNDERVSV